MPGEFNIWVDPEAAAMVLSSGAPIRFIGLDVTLNVQLSRDDADRLRDSGRPFGSYAGQRAHAWIDYLASAHPGQNLLTAPMHDVKNRRASSPPSTASAAPCKT